jgi:hypothetical protein
MGELRGCGTARHSFGKVGGRDVRGSVFQAENNARGNSGGGANSGRFDSEGAAGWWAHGGGERFLFALDRDLVGQNRVTVHEAALLLVDNLWPHFDGKLVANRWISQTHGGCRVGGCSDRSATWQIFQDAVEAAGCLNIDDFGVHEIEAAIGNISPPRVGFGELFPEQKQEQRFEGAEDSNRRHQNSLFWLHPGNSTTRGAHGIDRRLWKKVQWAGPSPAETSALASAGARIASRESRVTLALAIPAPPPSPQSARTPSALATSMSE